MSPLSHSGTIAKPVRAPSLKRKPPTRKKTGTSGSLWGRLKGTGETQNEEVKKLTEEDTVIALMGPHGTGKSSFISMVVGRDVGIGHSLKPGTMDIKAFRVQMPGEDFGIVLVDTPGRDDAIKVTSDWLERTGRKKVRLSGILYFLGIDNPTAVPRYNIAMFEELCKYGACGNIILVTTMWDRFGEGIGGPREEKLKSTYWAPMIKRGSSVARHLNTQESAWNILNPFFDAAREQQLQFQMGLAETQKIFPSAAAVQEYTKRKGLLVSRVQKEMNKPDVDEEDVALLLGQCIELEKQRQILLTDAEMLETPFATKLRQALTGIPPQHLTWLELEVQASPPHVKLEELTEEDTVIALVGARGTGKSSFISTALDKVGREGRSLGSHTTKIRPFRVQVPGEDFSVVLVDTPGFDSLVSLTSILDGLGRSNLDGILYFHRISDKNSLGVQKQNLGIFEKLRGRGARRQIVLVTTMWDPVDEALAERHEAELKSTSWKPMINLGSGITRYQQTQASAWDILERFLGAPRERQELQLQQELFDWENALPDTPSAKEVSRAIRELIEKKESICKLKGRMGEPDIDEGVTTPEALEQWYEPWRDFLQKQFNALGKRREDLLLMIETLGVSSNQELHDVQPIPPRCLQWLKSEPRTPPSSAPASPVLQPFPRDLFPSALTSDHPSTASSSRVSTKSSARSALSGKSSPPTRRSVRLSLIEQGSQRSRATVDQVLSLPTSPISELPEGRPVILGSVQVSPIPDEKGTEGTVPIPSPATQRPSGNIPSFDDLTHRLLSRIICNASQGVMTKLVAGINREDAQAMADFLNKVLSEKDILPTDEGNRILVMLSKLATSTRVYPKRFILNDVRYDPRPKVRGGFASVHVGRFQKRSICAKVIPNEEDMNACVKEVILWAHLQHRNILPFYGVHQLSEDSDFCLVSPWMSNGTICEFAARENLSQQSRMHLISDVINGLLYLHGLNIVHSDLKGQNVLISDDRRALITDFGISHIATATARPNCTSSLIGATIRWAPPESLDHERSKRPTKAWDVWSFGCLCYEILSRRIPFHECRSDTQVIVALLKNEFPSRPELVSDDWDQIDDPVWDLMRACWEPRPEDRPTLRDIRDGFERLGVQDDRPSLPVGPWSDTALLHSGGESSIKLDFERLEKILHGLECKVEKDRSEGLGREESSPGIQSG